LDKLINGSRIKSIDTRIEIVPFPCDNEEKLNYIEIINEEKSNDIKIIPTTTIEKTKDIKELVTSLLKKEKGEKECEAYNDTKGKATMDMAKSALTNLHIKKKI
jgi:hypothetical protein